jgi:hypothetical protein
MKKGSVMAVATWLIIISGIAYAFVVQTSMAGGTTQESPPAAARKIIDVHELAANPKAFRGDITLRGVVAGVNKAQGVFGIIDAREFKSCGTLSCAVYTLPIKYSRKAPALKSLVTIRGRVVKSGKGMIIVARNVKAVK